MATIKLPVVQRLIPRHVQVIPPDLAHLPHNDKTRQAIEYVTRDINKIFALVWNELIKKQDRT
jgi:hypothetical protein